MPVLVSCRLRQTLKVGGKPLFAWVWRGGLLRGHVESVSPVISPWLKSAPVLKSFDAENVSS